MPVWLVDAGTLVVGIVLLLVGGDVLVRGAVSLATRLGISPLIVGLTVVAFGTSAPELALNVSAALNGNTDLSFGNIVGSNIANIGLILGLSSLMRPMAVHATLLKREIPVLIVVSVGATAAALWGPGAAGSAGLSRIEGVVLLAGFVCFLEMMRRGAKGNGAAGLIETPEGAGATRLPVSVGLVLVGLALLALGGALSERGAVGVARAAGLSDAVIGLTVVAVATSLPELATSVMAARRGQVDIAVGNVVGSNIFNILLVLGVSATIAPTPTPAGGARALAVMLGLAVVLVPMSRTHKGSISRVEGAVLLAVYAGSVAMELALA